MKNKNYIIVIGIILAFSLVMYFLLGKDNLHSEQRTANIIVGDNTVFKYEKNAWKVINSEMTKQKLNWQEFEVYVNNSSLGRYYLTYDTEKWNIFDANKQKVKRDGPLVAYNANYDLKIQSFTSEEIKNTTSLNRILKENNLGTNQEYTVATETSIDIDSDGINEKLYFVSNSMPLETTPKKIFTFVFMEKGNDIYIIYKKIEDNDNNVNGCKPYLSSVFDIDLDNNYELIVSCGRFSVAIPDERIYKFTEKGFEMLISNQ